MTAKLLTRVLDASDAGINQCWAKVYKDIETGEFFVKFYKDSEYLGKRADYHTDDKLDAIQTARHQCLRGW